MSTINILGIDIGKSTFHLVGHDSSGREVFRKKLSSTKLILFLANTERTTVDMESCGGSHWDLLISHLLVLKRQIKSRITAAII